MILPSPPLPPWKGRKTVQRSYSSEMLNSDTMIRYNNGKNAGLWLVRSDKAWFWLVKYSGVGEYRETAETQIPTESSGYQSGSLSKPHKSNSGEMSGNIFKALPILILLNLMELKSLIFWNFVRNNFLRGMRSTSKSYSAINRSWLKNLGKYLAQYEKKSPLLMRWIFYVCHQKVFINIILWGRIGPIYLNVHKSFSSTPKRRNIMIMLILYYLRERWNIANISTGTGSKQIDFCAQSP